MAENIIIRGAAAPLPIANLDTDQIMPKQFLRGIDKEGLAQGLFYDLRMDEQGQPRPGFVLNQAAYAQCSILIGGPNFGCGSSREHAVWGLQQFGIKAVIAPSFGEIFYSNAMNNRLMLVMLDEQKVQRLLDEASAADGPLDVEINVSSLTVSSGQVHAPFTLSARHHGMFLRGLDMVGETLTHKDEITAFAQAWHARYPWLTDVSRVTRDRLARQG